MNGKPEQVVVSIAISSKFSVEALDQLYDGMKEACRIYGVDLVGGDTTSSLSGLIINVTAIGSVEKGKAVKRNSANENDLICVSGDLGGAYLGLQILEREKKLFLQDTKIQPKLDNHKYAIRRQLKPEARKDIINLLNSHKILPTSMIDISDGLSSEILHISEQSNLGCRIFEDKIPISYECQQTAGEINIDPTLAAMNGGEDYELLFTISLKDHENIQSIPGISIIGHMTPKKDSRYLIARNGTEVPINAQGWNALLEKE
jgi:thiamine-monophosphate kinase